MNWLQILQKLKTDYEALTHWRWHLKSTCSRGKWEVCAQGLSRLGGSEEYTSEQD